MIINIFSELKVERDRQFQSALSNFLVVATSFSASAQFTIT